MSATGSSGACEHGPRRGPEGYSTRPRGPGTGLPAVLQALARVMGSIGSVTSGLVSEVAGVEGWLQQRPP